MYRWQKDRIRNAAITPWEADQALEAMLDERTDEVVRFFEEGGADTIMPVELFIKYGLPRMDGSERDDALRDRYASAFEAILGDLRSYAADTIAERIQAAREQTIGEQEEVDAIDWIQVQP